MSLARLGRSGGGAPSGQEKTSGLYDSRSGQKATDGKTVGGPGIGVDDPAKATTNLPITLGRKMAPGRKAAGTQADGFPDVLQPGGQQNP